MRTVHANGGLRSKSAIIASVSIAAFAIGIVGNRVSADAFLFALSITTAIAGYVLLMRAGVNPLIAGPVVAITVFISIAVGNLAPYVLHFWGQSVGQYGSQDQPGLERFFATILFIGPIVAAAGLAIGLVTSIFLSLKQPASPTSR